MKEWDILFSTAVSADNSVNLYVLFTKENKKRGMWGLLVKVVQGGFGLRSYRYREE